MMDFAQARRNMVDCQLRTFDVNDRAVLAAMAELPRELFVPPGREALAYLDQAVPVLGSGRDARALLAPMVLARLVQALAVRDGERALDVAGGTGFSAALLSRLGADVVTLEEPSVGDRDAGSRLARLGLAVRSRQGPLAEGASDAGPFDIILINGAVERRPERLLAQLAPEGGRLACLSRQNGATRAVLFIRSGEGFGFRPLFDAAGPVLPAFQDAPAFSF